MKKIIITLVIITLISVITCCKPNRNIQNQNDKINVTTTIFPAYDFVRQIAGDRVNLTMLLSPGAESHSFEPSPRDIITIQNSDIFIYIGGDSDTWVRRILRSMNTENMKIYAMMDFVEVVAEELVEGMECAHDHHHEDCDDECDHDIEYDEHVWTSPRNAILIVRAITELLCEIDPANSAFYRENAAAYIGELEQLDSAFAEVVAGAKRRTIVFGDRFPFRYFVDTYGLTYFAAFSGCSTETEPSAATVAFLINTIRTEQIPVVFHIELSNERMANTISEETGAKKLLLHSVHNVTRRDFDAGLGYLELMHRNVDNLREALH
jgi:zinc transport system substrate-binding protein